MGIFDDDYGPIRGPRDAWAFTEYTPPPRYPRRKLPTITDADAVRIMAKWLDSHSYFAMRSEQERISARNRETDDLPY